METCNIRHPSNHFHHADKRSASIDNAAITLIDSKSLPQSHYLVPKHVRNTYLMPDEFGIYRDTYGYARAMNGMILHISTNDIADILQVANRQEKIFTQQRSHPDNQPQFQDNHHATDAAETVFQRSRPPTNQQSIDIAISPSIPRAQH